ncbi:ParB/RepB/Spo0J family partition protein, partial [Flavobacteriales bacterium]|nr:ParB/RepB/Spo0J family partition protein [Flavobacteriales bacterium]
MKNKRNALGRGLSAILRNPKTDITENRDNEKNLVSTINNISIEDIQINPFQPRTEFDEEKLFELSESIKELGIIQPITVRKLGYNKYQLISGERRLRASKILNLKTIPSYIRIANDEQMLEMALVENIQRDNLNPIDIALSFQRLIKECNLTQEECGNKLGKQRSTITNFLRLLKLPSKIQEGLKKERITVGHARALININDKENQLNIYHDIIESGFS